MPNHSARFISIPRSIEELEPPFYGSIWLHDFPVFRSLPAVLPSKRNHSHQMDHGSAAHLAMYETKTVASPSKQFGTLLHRTRSATVVVCALFCLTQTCNRTTMTIGWPWSCSNIFYAPVASFTQAPAKPSGRVAGIYRQPFGLTVSPCNG